jgi:hypothetical protein
LRLSGADRPSPFPGLKMPSAPSSSASSVSSSMPKALPRPSASRRGPLPVGPWPRGCATTAGFCWPPIAPSSRRPATTIRSRRRPNG